MSKAAKIGFWVFNIIFLLFNLIFVNKLPNPLLFGWMPLQLFCYFVSAPVASVVWYLYFSRFFKGQKDLDLLDANK